MASNNATICLVSDQDEACEFLVEFLTRIKHLDDSPEQTETSIEIDDDEPKELSSSNLSMKEKMMLAVSNARQVKSAARRTEDDLQSQVRRELQSFEKNGTKGPMLQMCYENLLNVAPTRVESERAFSSSASICTKIRSRMSDDTLDTLCLLTHLFLKK